MATIRYAEHTDSVQQKLQLIAAAYRAGQLDIAMSLAASIKETLGFERQLQTPDGAPQIAADKFVPTGELPPAVARWARGWSYAKPVTLFETVGIAREKEPIELDIAFPADQVTDLAREVRVARCDKSQPGVREVPSQVLSLVRSGKEFRATLLFLAQVDEHESAQYLVFYGNPLAELPNYPSELRVEGEGCGLTISNQHFTVRLSRQTGQIERIISAREHGLELYAGGKGHGEPPDIDWGHDYVDDGHFQKLRMRNWSRCPNYEVVRGPLCVGVRRWGFPHSPVHPLFTPSRIHMDISYAFYGGLPYFVKRGRSDVIENCLIEATRDDEWVFSGYSFTDMVWIDRQGRLREGAVPPDQAEALWGVGFYNRTSRDAFVALRLEHAATGFDIRHGGVPTLHYAGHGQLWSRYPEHKAELAAGTTLRQTNAYLFTAWPEPDAAGAIQQLRHRLLHPLAVRDEMPSLADTGAVGTPLARFGETADTAPLKPIIWKTLAAVRDEQLYTAEANIVDLGWVYDVQERNGIVRVLVTMPHRGRPVYQFLVSQGGGRVEEGIRERLSKLAGVRDVIVDFTWEPAWTSARLTDKGRAALALPA